MRLVDVALPVPLRQLFTYRVPEAAPDPAPGTRVLCPFGKRALVGIVVQRTERVPEGTDVRTLLKLVEGGLPAELVQFATELAKYYYAPLGEVLKLALPPIEREVAEEARAARGELFATVRGVAKVHVQFVELVDVLRQGEKTSQEERRLLDLLAETEGTRASIAALEQDVKSARRLVKKLAARGAVRVVSGEKAPDPFFGTAVPRDTPPVLTDAQRAAHTRIAAALEKDAGCTFLLDGVTGSGKTEVYLHAIAVAKERKRGTIVLVPEIALTPQLVGRFRARFGDDVAVLHSALTEKERHSMWHRLERGEVDVAIGARSALFAPVQNLGLLIVDEEHDPSFKQEEGVRYHARDMAILRAHRSRAVCILGSATPSLEMEQLTSTQRAERLVLPNRARAQELPKIELVDMRRIAKGPIADVRISLPLYRALEETLAKGEQTILFLNRRGFSPSVRCGSCGVVVSCPHCSVALTFHKSKKGLVDEYGTIVTTDSSAGHVRCHYCDYATFAPLACTSCQAQTFVLDGLGTEKLEEALVTAFPSARVARLDRDVASGKKVEAILDKVRNREVDILVGTQMVTKGHDLPEVTLVGVINADAALSMPDFRAAERTFHLLVQVAGRAGRGERKGRVIVQTYTPEHPTIVFASKHDTRGFTARELIDRRELNYPPFSKMAVFRVDGLDEAEVKRTAGLVAGAITYAEHPNVDVLGPAAAPLVKLKNRFRYRTVLRAQDRLDLRRAIAAAQRALHGVASRIRVVVDVDPVNLM